MNDIICFDVVNADRSGITVKGDRADVKISFAECAKNYAKEKSLATSNCVATRDATKLTFIFYTHPKTRVTFKKRFLQGLFSGKTAVGKFLELQRTIRRYGYTSYDLS